MPTRSRQTNFDVTGTKYGSPNIGAPGKLPRLASLPDGLLAKVIEGICGAGDCVMFSNTSDGGAMHVRILADGLVEKWYPSSTTELQSVLERVLEVLEANRKT